MWSISRGAVTRLIRLETYIDHDWTTTYNADALIIATATGSTAYALATGGPILPPELRNILVVPVAPHLSLERPIVLPEGAMIEVRRHAGQPVRDRPCRRRRAAVRPVFRRPGQRAGQPVTSAASCACASAITSTARCWIGWSRARPNLPRR